MFQKNEFNILEISSRSGLGGELEQPFIVETITRAAILFSWIYLLRIGSKT